MNSQVEDAKTRIEAMLEPGETLRWVGRPVQGVIFRWTDVFLTAYAAAFPIFVLSMPKTLSDRVFDQSLFGLMMTILTPLAAVSVIDILFVRYWWDARHRRRVVYGLSTSRAFIATPRRVRAYALDKHPLVVERRNVKWLTLRFGNDKGNWPWGGHIITVTGLFGSIFAPRFDAIPVEPMASLLKLGSGRQRKTPQDP